MAHLLQLPVGAVVVAAPLRANYTPSRYQPVQVGASGCHTESVSADPHVPRKAGPPYAGGRREVDGDVALGERENWSIASCQDWCAELSELEVDKLKRVRLQTGEDTLGYSRIVGSMKEVVPDLVSTPKPVIEIGY